MKPTHGMITLQFMLVKEGMLTLELSSYLLEIPNDTFTAQADWFISEFN